MEESEYELEDVTDRPALWSGLDPVRPELSDEFRTSPGRGVFGLKGPDGAWKAFMCYARTSAVPKDVAELDRLTHALGNIVIPYTVWSNEKGAGRAIINEVLWHAKLDGSDNGIDRIVTLSPQTEMARSFHLRNSAIELFVNQDTVNFEYLLHDVEAHDEADEIPANNRINPNDFEEKFKAG